MLTLQQELLQESNTSIPRHSRVPSPVRSRRPLTLAEELEQEHSETAELIDTGDGSFAPFTPDRLKEWGTAEWPDSSSDNGLTTQLRYFLFGVEGTPGQADVSKLIKSGALVFRLNAAGELELKFANNPAGQELSERFRNASADPFMAGAAVGVGEVMAPGRPGSRWGRLGRGLAKAYNVVTDYNPLFGKYSITSGIKATAKYGAIGVSETVGRLPLEQAARGLGIRFLTYHIERGLLLGKSSGDRQLEFFYDGFKDIDRIPDADLWLSDIYHGRELTSPDRAPAPFRSPVNQDILQKLLQNKGNATVRFLELYAEQEPTLKLVAGDLITEIKAGKVLGSNDQQHLVEYLCDAIRGGQMRYALAILFGGVSGRRAQQAVQAGINLALVMKTAPVLIGGVLGVVAGKAGLAVSGQQLYGMVRGVSTLKSTAAPIIRRTWDQSVEQGDRWSETIMAVGGVSTYLAIKYLYPELVEPLLDSEIGRSGLKLLGEAENAAEDLVPDLVGDAATLAAAKAGDVVSTIKEGAASVSDIAPLGPVVPGDVTMGEAAGEAFTSLITSGVLMNSVLTDVSTQLPAAFRGKNFKDGIVPTLLNLYVRGAGLQYAMNASQNLTHAGATLVDTYGSDDFKQALAKLEPFGLDNEIDRPNQGPTQADLEKAYGDLEHQVISAGDGTVVYRGEIESDTGEKVEAIFIHDGKSLYIYNEETNQRIEVLTLDTDQNKMVLQEIQTESGTSEGIKITISKTPDVPPAGLPEALQFQAETPTDTTLPHGLIVDSAIPAQTGAPAAAAETETVVETAPDTDGVLEASDLTPDAETDGTTSPGTPGAGETTDTTTEPGTPEAEVTPGSSTPATTEFEPLNFGDFHGQPMTEGAAGPQPLQIVNAAQVDATVEELVDLQPGHWMRVEALADISGHNDVTDRADLRHLLQAAGVMAPGEDNTIVPIGVLVSKDADGDLVIAVQAGSPAATQMHAPAAVDFIPNQSDPATAAAFDTLEAQAEVWIDKAGKDNPERTAVWNAYKQVSADLEAAQAAADPAALAQFATKYNIDPQDLDDITKRELLNVASIIGQGHKVIDYDDPTAQGTPYLGLANIIDGPTVDSSGYVNPLTAFVADSDGDGINEASYYQVEKTLQSGLEKVKGLDGDMYDVVNPGTVSDIFSQLGIPLTPENRVKFIQNNPDIFGIKISDATISAAATVPTTGGTTIPAAAAPTPWDPLTGAAPGTPQVPAAPETSPEAPEAANVNSLSTLIDANFGSVVMSADAVKAITPDQDFPELSAEVMATPDYRVVDAAGQTVAILNTDQYGDVVSTSHGWISEGGFIVDMAADGSLGVVPTGVVSTGPDGSLVFYDQASGVDGAHGKLYFVQSTTNFPTTNFATVEVIRGGVQSAASVSDGQTLLIDAAGTQATNTGYRMNGQPLYQQGDIDDAHPLAGLFVVGNPVPLGQVLDADPTAPGVQPLVLSGSAAGSEKVDNTSAEVQNSDVTYVYVPDDGGGLHLAGIYFELSDKDDPNIKTSVVAMADGVFQLGSTGLQKLDGGVATVGNVSLVVETWQLGQKVTVSAVSGTTSNSNSTQADATSWYSVPNPHTLSPHGDVTQWIEGNSGDNVTNFDDPTKYTNVGDIYHDGDTTRAVYVDSEGRAFTRTPGALGTSVINYVGVYLDSDGDGQFGNEGTKLLILNDNSVVEDSGRSIGKFISKDAANNGLRVDIILHNSPTSQKNPYNLITTQDADGGMVNSVLFVNGQAITIPDLNGRLISTINVESMHIDAGDLRVVITEPDQGTTLLAGKLDPDTNVLGSQSRSVLTPHSGNGLFYEDVNGIFYDANLVPVENTTLVGGNKLITYAGNPYIVSATTGASLDDSSGEGIALLSQIGWTWDDAAKQFVPTGDNSVPADQQASPTDTATPEVTQQPTETTTPTPDQDAATPAPVEVEAPERLAADDPIVATLQDIDMNTQAMGDAAKREIYVDPNTYAAYAKSEDGSWDKVGEYFAAADQDGNNSADIAGDITNRYILLANGDLVNDVGNVYNQYVINGNTYYSHSDFVNAARSIDPNTHILNFHNLIIRPELNLYYDGKTDTYTSLDGQDLGLTYNSQVDDDQLAVTEDGKVLYNGRNTILPADIINARPEQVHHLLLPNRVVHEYNGQFYSDLYGVSIEVLSSIEDKSVLLKTTGGVYYEVDKDVWKIKALGEELPADIEEKYFHNRLPADQKAAATEVTAVTTATPAAPTEAAVPTNTPAPTDLPVAEVAINTVADAGTAGRLVEVNMHTPAGGEGAPAKEIRVDPQDYSAYAKNTDGSWVKVGTFISGDSEDANDVDEQGDITPYVPRVVQYADGVIRDSNGDDFMEIKIAGATFYTKENQGAAFRFDLPSHKIVESAYYANVEDGYYFDKSANEYHPLNNEDSAVLKTVELLPGSYATLVNNTLVVDSQDTSLPVEVLDHPEDLKAIEPVPGSEGKFLEYDGKYFTADYLAINPEDVTASVDGLATLIKLGTDYYEVEKATNTFRFIGTTLTPAQQNKYFP